MKAQLMLAIFLIMLNLAKEDSKITLLMTDILAGSKLNNKGLGVNLLKIL